MSDMLDIRDSWLSSEQLEQARERLPIVYVEAIPVRVDGRTVAVLARESALSMTRQPGELEREYLDVFERFARGAVAGRRNRRSSQTAGADSAYIVNRNSSIGGGFATTNASDNGTTTK